LKYSPRKIRFLFYFSIISLTVISYYTIGFFGKSVIESDSENLKQRANVTSTQIKEVLEQNFDRKLALAKTLAAFVKNNPTISQNEFADFAKYLYESSKNDLISIQLVKDSIITYNYPIIGNEATIGVNILTIPSDQNNVSNAYRNKEAMSVGPRNLIQEKLGVVYREPIILDDIENTLIGYAVIVLDQMFLKIPIIINNKKNIAIYSSKSGIDSSGFFYGNLNVDKANCINKTSKVPLDNWTISFQISDPGYINYTNWAAKLFLLFTSLIIASLFAFSLKSILKTINNNHLLSDQNRIINLQLEEKRILIGEIHHRIKNHFQMLSSLNRIKYLDSKDERIIEIINEINNRVLSMSQIYDQLSGSEKNTLGLNEYIQFLINNLISSLDSSVKVDIEINKETLDIKRTISLGVILTEIITNSLKHAFKRGENKKIKVSIQYIDNNYIISLLDNGNLIPLDILDTEHTSQGIELMKLISSQLKANLELIKTPSWNGFKIQFKA
jgi:two-component sensor histidine kinase